MAITHRHTALTGPLLGSARQHFTSTRVVCTVSNVWYQVNSVSGGVYFSKSSDNGMTWGPSVQLSSSATNSVRSIDLWYDRWSNISAGLIHVAWVDDGIDDILYRSIDTESSDSLSTEATVFAGVSAAAGGNLSITRARGGNLYIHGVIDAGAEGGFYRSVDVGATWGARTVNEVIATTDQILLMPGWAADNQDIMAFFWDASADEISRQLYDNSADTWAETSIAASMVELALGTAQPNMAAAVDITNSQNLLVAWSAADTLNADLRCWKVTESAITEVTNVVQNSTDDQALCGIVIDTQTQDWYVYYCGKSDGSETWPTSVNVYYKVSTDDGATWGSETALTTTAADTRVLLVSPRAYTNHIVQRALVVLSGNIHDIVTSGPYGLPQAQLTIGI